MQFFQQMKKIFRLHNFRSTAHVLLKKWSVNLLSFRGNNQKLKNVVGSLIDVRRDNSIACLHFWQNWGALNRMNNWILPVIEKQQLFCFSSVSSQKVHHEGRFCPVVVNFLYMIEDTAYATLRRSINITFIQNTSTARVKVETNILAIALISTFSP